MNRHIRRQEIDHINEDSLFLDSSLIAKCGMFYTAITKGQVFSTAQEIEDFNKRWCKKIKQEMHYEKYYLAFGIENALELLCDRSEEGVFILTNEGVATMLSEVQRYARSKMNVKNFMIILDRMIKCEISKSKREEALRNLQSLKNQLNKYFETESPETFATDEQPNVLATRILVALAEIYTYGTYRTAADESKIGELIRLVKQREQKYKDIVKNQTAVEKQPQKFLDVAKQIREDKILAYRKIYENMIGRMDEAFLERTDV